MFIDYVLLLNLAASNESLQVRAGVIKIMLWKPVPKFVDSGNGCLRVKCKIKSTILGSINN